MIVRVFASAKRRIEDREHGAPDRTIRWPKKEKPRIQFWIRGSSRVPGGDLLSHRASPAVPSALEVLTSEFEMGSGVTPPVRPPKLSSSASFECRTPAMSQNRWAPALLNTTTAGPVPPIAVLRTEWLRATKLLAGKFCLECRNQAARSKNFVLNQVDGASTKKKSNGGQASRPISTG